MRRIIAVWIVMIMLMGGILGFVNLSTDAEASNGDVEIRVASQSKSGLTSHDPISIHNNSDFASQATSEGWAGNETEGDPYIIENYDIDASTATGIDIRNTDVYFIIRNCVIHDGGSSYYGIYFYNVQNGIIDNVTSYNNHFGVEFEYSSNSNIANCIVYNNHCYGIFLDYSTDNNITNCDVHNNSWGGIDMLHSSNNNQIINCNVYNNSWRGIYIYSSSNNNTISNSNVYNNDDDGIRLDISSNNNTISNCDVYNNDEGIYLFSSSNNNLISCGVYNNSGSGIGLWNSSNNNLISCAIYNNSWSGIELSSSSNNNQIINCEVYNNSKYGILLVSSSNNNITGNTFTNDGILIGGSLDIDDCVQTIENNTINGKSLYYFLNRDSITLDGIDAGQLILVNCTNFNIKNLGISHTDVGLELLYSSNNNATSNQIHDNFEGLYLENSSNNQITNCGVYNNSWRGIEICFSSNNNTISNCDVYNNSGFGIKLDSSSNNNTITNCDVYNNKYGVYLGVLSSSNNEIHYNNIYNNTAYGIYNYNSEIEYQVNATYNWWGSATGPRHPDTNPNGTGDNVTDNVLYNPWLTEPWNGEDVNQPPVADFTYSPALIVSTTGRIINFMDLSYDPDGNITAWFWELGDNSTSTLQNPTHQYPVAGNYTVNLTVTDDDAATNTTSKEITITVFDIGIIINISLTNFTFLNLTYLNISYIVNIMNTIIINISYLNITDLVNITNLSLINISCINITNLMNISNMSFANVFEVILTNITYMSSSSFINVSYINITQSMSINNLMFNNVSYAYLQNITSVNFVITAIPNIITIAYENLQMVIPAEALILSMPFNLSTTSALLPQGYDVVGDIYRIECGVSIGAPISITLSYAGIVLPPRINEDDLAVYKKVGDNWIKIDSIIDKLNNTVSVEVTSFSDYAILYKQPSTEEEEESKPSAKPFEIPWLYILIPIIIIIILVVTGISIKCRKKKLPPEKPTG